MANKVTVRCVTANLQHSPKPEDNVVQYRFVQTKPPQGHPGDLFLEGAVAIYKAAPNTDFVVGNEYEMTLEEVR